MAFKRLWHKKPWTVNRGSAVDDINFISGQVLLAYSLELPKTVRCAAEVVDGYADTQAAICNARN